MNMSTELFDSIKAMDRGQRMDLLFACLLAELAASRKPVGAVLTAIAGGGLGQGMMLRPEDYVHSVERTASGEWIVVSCRQNANDKQAFRTNSGHVCRCATCQQKRSQQVHNANDGESHG